jgi:beta-lactamase superfamily II metal-dependent hydrolase
MPTKKNSSGTKQGGGSPGTSSASVRIRMYRVGFGDCFLVTLGGQYHILVDCGVHNKGNIKLNGGSLIDKAFQNIQQETGSKLAIVIATHAHQDHVSGYGKFAGEFGKFEIGEVWMPWTDNPSDPTAQKWHQTKQALTAQLQAAFTGARGNNLAAAATDNAIANPQAMNALHSGFGKAKVRYLKAGDQVDAPAGLTGFSAKILGPPQDETFISKMNPPGSDEYLRLASSSGSGKASHAFTTWEVPDKQVPKGWPVLSSKIAASLEDQGHLSAAAVAFSLDKVLNNTSIVALFTWAGRHLLFPGDAQYGDWSYWYLKSGADLLSEICFYKVAHHGSQNATPKGALAEMPQGKFAAMMSTQNKPWPSIPRGPLVDALDKQTNHAVVRSDSLAVTGAPNGPALPTNLPSQFVAGQVSKGEYWIDYNIA